MRARTADPARTHALLVGIEKYAAGAEWNRLLGPVPDVLAFHKWLRSRGVPADQITTLVSPLDDNAALVEQAKIDTKPATSAEVLNALDVLRPRHGDLLFLFWAGHGVVHEDEHRLFLADATKDHKRNLDLEALEKSLRSTYFPGFPLQILLVDACANYQRFTFTFPGEPVPCGEPLPREQFVFFAARPGQVAKDLGEERHGLFASEFLSEVQEHSDSSWPPDMRAVAEAVQARFAALRATSKLNQTPVWRSVRDWDGNEIEMIGPKQVAARLTGPDAATLTPSQLIALARALATLPIMGREGGRNLVLKQMRSNVAAATSRGADTMSDTINIVRTASNYPGGLEELLWLIYQFESESLSWGAVTKVVAQSMPNLRIPAAQPPARSSVSEVTIEQLALVDALARCPTLATSGGRDLCVSLLNEPIPAKIERQDSAKTDLLCIVSACMNYVGGLEGLVAAVEAREGTSIHMPRVKDCVSALRERHGAD